MASGKPSGAEVVGGEPAAHFMHSGGADVSVPWNMQLRVVPADEPPFDLSVKMEMPILMAPTPGTTLQVIYNPEHPEQIVVDPQSVPKDKKEAFTDYAIDSARVMGVDTTGMQEAADAETDPIAAAEAATAQMRANVMARSNALLAESLRAPREGLEAQAAAGSPPAPAGSEGEQPGSGTPEETSVEAFEAQLAKLNNLKATGAIDENQYQALRQKLIDAI
jgi:hypothetical protein